MFKKEIEKHLTSFKEQSYLWFQVNLSTNLPYENNQNHLLGNYHPHFFI